MRAIRAASLAVVLVLVLPAASAVAQVSVDPSVTPELNTGGWIRGLAFVLAAIGLLVLLLVVVAFMRFAPRFSTDETAFRVVRADRVRPGEELPRRTVDVKAAAPVIVAPPPLPQPASVGATPQAAAAPAPAPVSAPAAPAAPSGPGSEAPSTAAPKAAPGSEGAPAEADAATAARETPDAATSEAAPAPVAAPSAPAEHADVSMDQEVFEQKLQELLAQGTDKRVAEGQARRAAMIAARKKAAGG